MSVLIVTEAQLRACIPSGIAALEQVENAFTWLAQGRVSMPPVMHIEIDRQSAVDAKGAYVQGIDAFAIKIASGFFANPARNLPSCSSTIVLLNSETGFCQCVFLDNGYLMDLRTGLAGAVAAKHLAPRNVNTVGVIGTGVQARYQVECLALVRRFERVIVAGRTSARVAGFCEEMAERLGVQVVEAGSREQLVRESQIVVTTTSAQQPLISADWVHPGLHITAMGADLPGKQELDPHILAAADMVVCDNTAQCLIGGELQHSHAAGVEAEVIELGAITSGLAPPRRSDDQLTVCDLTGTGAQDTAIAIEAYTRALKAGIGTCIS